ncbi:MAG: PAS domain S-box protein [Anaerolineae bacterium]|nr:PAS domain S-box protein [Anaerolineae bacterium]
MINDSAPHAPQTATPRPAWWRWLVAVWALLTEPAVSVTEPAQRRQAHLLTSLLVALLGGGLVATFGSVLLEPARYPLDHPDTLLSMGVLVILFIIYLVSRSRYTQTAIILTIHYVSLFIFLTALPNDTPDDVGVLAYLLIPILLSSTLLSLRATVMFILLNAAGVLAFAFYVGDGPGLRALQNMIFLLLLSGLLLLAMRHRELIAGDRRARLEEEERRYRSLVNVSPDAIIVCRNGQLLFANPAWERLAGDLPGDMIATPDITSFLPGHRQAHVTERIRCALENNQPLDFFDEVLLRPDGSEVAIEIGGAPLTLAGQPAIQLVIRDVTERQRALERSLELLVQRERADALTQFIDDVSQGLKTPLSTIRLSLAILERAPDPAKQQQHLASLNVQTDYLQGVLEDMRSIVHLDSTKGLSLHLVDLNAVVRRVALSHEGRAAQAGVTLNYTPPESLVTAQANREELTRALNALVQNALHHTPSGGTITLHLEATPEHVIIAVRDSAPAIAPDALKTIFEHFHYGKAEGRVPQGVGLGLAVARRIVEAHTGQLTAESTPDAGNIFRITLPLLSDAAQAAGDDA